VIHAEYSLGIIHAYMLIVLVLKQILFPFGYIDMNSLNSVLVR